MIHASRPSGLQPPRRLPQATPTRPLSTTAPQPAARRRAPAAQPVLPAWMMPIERVIQAVNTACSRLRMIVSNNGAN